MGCVVYLKNVTVLDNEQIICCNDKTSEKTDPDGDSEFFDALAQQAVDFKVDIRIFNYIIKQKDQLVRELYDKIEILKINNKLLEDNASKLPSTKHNIENSKNGQSNNSSKNTKNIPAVTYAEKEIPTIDLQGVSNKHVASAILKEQTKLKFNEIINLTKDQRDGKAASEPGSSSMKQTVSAGVEDHSGGEWKKVERKPRKNNVVIGNRGDTNIKGVPKYTYLHVYRIDKETTVESLTALLANHFPEVICESITPKHPEMYSSFRIGIYDRNFRKAMDPSIWPSGACVSRSPNSNCNVFIECITDVLYDLYKSSHTLFLLGDLNIDPIRDKREFAKLCNALNVFGLTPRVKWPTRVTNSAASTIDNIFSNCSTESASLAVDNNISDHRTLLFDCEDNTQQVKCHTMNFMRSFSDQATQNFISDILTEDWLQVYNSNNMNIAYSHFHGIFSFYFEKHFPKRRKNCRPANSNPWINEKIIESSEKLKDLHYMKLDNPHSGYDEVPSVLKRAVLHIIIDPLVYLVNLSFVTGFFPERLKLGKLVPIHKTGNVKSVENYRPIIMPSVFSKIEKKRLAPIV
nr:unnamed protein product [Callosobruchus chinensis]